MVKFTHAKEKERNNNLVQERCKKNGVFQSKKEGTYR